MASPERLGVQERVLVLIPAKSDTSIQQILSDEVDIRWQVYHDLETFCHELEQGAVAAVIDEEALGNRQTDTLLAVLERQLPWSDLPILLLFDGAHESREVSQALEAFGNVTPVERQAHRSTVIHALHTAIHNRHHQYQIRDLLIRLADELAEVDQQREQFLAMLAHELRNPLAPLFNSLQIVRQAGSNAQIRDQAIDMIGRSVRYLAHVIDDLLETSRIIRGKVRLRQEKLDVSQLLRTTVEDRRSTLERAGLKLVMDIPEPATWVWGDPTRLSQVFHNLLDNAAKFSERGGQVMVRLQALPCSQCVVIRIRDTGIGIEPKILPRLFGPFVQADRSLERSRGGLGLGLSVAKGLVEMHGGEIEAASEGPGKGAEFTVRLPTEPELAPLMEHPELIATHR